MKSKYIIIGIGMLFCLAFFSLPDAMGQIEVCFTLHPSLRRDCILKERERISGAVGNSTKTYLDITKLPGNETTVKEIGTMKWFDTTKGYGFIKREKGAELFVHWRNFIDVRLQGDLSSGARLDWEGKHLKFEVVEGFRGLQASNVEVFIRRD
jgi:CspA family cold shock protein